MKRINLAAVIEWDDLELLRAEAGKFLRNSPSADDLANYRRISDCAPRVEIVKVVTGSDCFSVTPGPDQVHNQLAYGSLYRIARSLGWRVSNIGRRFDPLIAMRVSRLYGVNRLRLRNSWVKVTAPAALVIEGPQQRFPRSVNHMIQALASEEPVMKIQTFHSLSMKSIAREMPPGEASQYLLGR